MAFNHLKLVSFADFVQAEVIPSMCFNLSCGLPCEDNPSIPCKSNFKIVRQSKNGQHNVKHLCRIWVHVHTQHPSLLYRHLKLCDAVGFYGENKTYPYEIPESSKLWCLLHNVPVVTKGKASIVRPRVNHALADVPVVTKGKASKSAIAMSSGADVADLSAAIAMSPGADVAATVVSPAAVVADSSSADFVESRSADHVESRDAYAVVVSMASTSDHDLIDVGTVSNCSQLAGMMLRRKLLSLIGSITYDDEHRILTVLVDESVECTPLESKELQTEFMKWIRGPYDKSIANKVSQFVHIRNLYCYWLKNTVKYDGSEVNDSIKPFIKLFKPIFNTSGRASFTDKSRRALVKPGTLFDKSEPNLKGLEQYCNMLRSSCDAIIGKSHKDPSGYFQLYDPVLLKTMNGAKIQLHHTDEDDYGVSIKSGHRRASGISLNELRKYYSLSIWAPLDNNGRDLYIYHGFIPTGYDQDGDGLGNYPTQHHRLVGNLGDVVVFHTTAWHSGGTIPSLGWHAYYDRISTTPDNHDIEELSRRLNTTFSNCKRVDRVDRVTSKYEKKRKIDEV